jgi:SAM-dependent methyltransferase
LEYKNQLLKNNEAIKIDSIYPQLKDKIPITPLDPIYFYQDTWAAKKIFDLNPEHHFDVGSSAKTIGLISQFVPTTMVDIRPLELKLDNLYFKEGTILSLPFENETIKSISSLCVVEHIGLGRYGDPIDVYGSEKAVRELIRVTVSGGIILFSVPVGLTNKVFFNAHRVFKREYLLNLFSNCNLIEEKYILERQFSSTFIDTDKFQIGLFMFKKK